MDSETVQITLTREQAQRLKDHARWQAQREDAISREPEMPEFLFDAAMTCIAMWESIADQLRAQDAGEGE